MTCWRATDGNPSRNSSIHPPHPPGPPHIADARETLINRLRTLAERMHGEPPSLATASPSALVAYYWFGPGNQECARETPA